MEWRVVGRSWLRRPSLHSWRPRVVIARLQYGILWYREEYSMVYGYGGLLEWALELLRA